MTNSDAVPVVAWMHARAYGSGLSFARPKDYADEDGELVKPTALVGKQPADWFWLLCYLGGKALNAAASGNSDKALHHTISTAAACANWHAAISGKHTQMRPGIDPVARGIEAAPSNPTTQPPEGR